MKSWFKATGFPPPPRVLSRYQKIYSLILANPNSGMYVLHNLHRQLSGTQFFTFLLKCELAGPSTRCTDFVTSTFSLSTSCKDSLPGEGGGVLVRRPTRWSACIRDTGWSNVSTWGRHRSYLVMKRANRLEIREACSFMQIASGDGRRDLIYILDMFIHI